MVGKMKSVRLVVKAKVCFSVTLQGFLEVVDGLLDTVCPPSATKQKLKLLLSTD